VVKRTNKQIRRALLSVLNDKKTHSFGSLERKVNTNWRTIRDHVETMKLFGAIEVIDGKIKITDFGVKIFKKIG